MSLVDRVIAAKQAAEAANASKGEEAQHAAMLIAQVQTIIAGETVTIEPAPEIDK